jgi:hypothetical protein
VRRITVVLYILPGGRVRQPVLVLCAHLLHNRAESLVAHFRGGVGRGQRFREGFEDGGGDGEVVCGAGDELGVGAQRDDWVRVAAEDALDRCRRIETCCYGAAEGFNAGDGFGGGAGNNDVDWGVQLVGVLYKC